MKSLGVTSFNQALRQLDCGKVEEFALQVLTHRCDLKIKAEILCKIIDQGPQMGKLFDKINDWDVVKDQLSSNKFFKEIIRITHRVLMLMKDQQLKGFDLKSLLKVFDVKSVYCKDKSVYYFIMKQYLQVSEHGNKKGYKLWKNIPI